jgi:hypothetical protein
MSFGPTSGKGTVGASNGLGPVTYIASVATATITVADAITELTSGANHFTIAGVEGTANGDHIAVQGTAAFPTISGITLVATFTD